MSPNPEDSNFNLKYLYLNLLCYFLCLSLHKMSTRPVLEGLWGSFMELLVFKFLTEMESFHCFSIALSLNEATLIFCCLNQ